MYVANRSSHLAIRRSNTLDERQKSDEGRQEGFRTFLSAEINSEFVFVSIVNDVHDDVGEMRSRVESSRREREEKLERMRRRAERCR